MTNKIPANMDTKRERKRKIIEDGIRDHVRLNSPHLDTDSVEIDISPCGNFVSVREKKPDKPDPTDEFKSKSAPRCCA